MTFGVAAAWAGRSTEPVAPFEIGSLLSTRATEQLSSIPAQDAAMKAALAQSALNEIGATARQRMSLQSQREVLAAQLAENAATRRQSRQQNIMRMAGTLLASSPPAAFLPASSADPLSLMASVNSLLAGDATGRAQSMAGSRAILAYGLKALS